MRAMKEHNLKCWPDYFQAIVDGRKCFEYRINDRYYEVGDILHLQEWDPRSRAYTGRDCFCKITYLLDLDDETSRDIGMAILSIRRIRKGRRNG